MSTTTNPASGGGSDVGSSGSNFLVPAAELANMLRLLRKYEHFAAYLQRELVLGGLGSKILTVSMHAQTHMHTHMRDTHIQASAPRKRTREEAEGDLCCYRCSMGNFCSEVELVATSKTIA